jgi:hypothetical protein
MRRSEYAAEDIRNNLLDTYRQQSTPQQWQIEQGYLLVGSVPNSTGYC